MAIILGIDPGSRITGYGVIDDRDGRLLYVDSGCIRATGESIIERLQAIFLGISQIVAVNQPETAAIEQVFMHQNPGAALKLGQARGAAIVAVKKDEIDMAEYSARQVKQAVVGYGAADKVQVQQMVCELLNLASTPQADAADALAIAICHAHSRKSLLNFKGASSIRHGRLR